MAMTSPQKSEPASSAAVAAKRAPVARKTAPVAKTHEPVKAPVAKPAAPVVKAEPVVVQVKSKKPRLIRDSFTFPKDEYALLEVLKVRAAKLGRPAKKTELLRAGIKLVAGLADGALLSALQDVPSLKTGRPAKSDS